MTDTDPVPSSAEPTSKTRGNWKSIIKDWMLDIDQFIDDRLRSPFMLSFIFSWLILNWQVPVAMLFEHDTVDVERIQEVLSEDYWRTLFWPAFISLGYVLCVKPLLNLVAAFGKWLHGASQKKHDDILKRTPINHSELATEKKRVKQLELKGRSAIIEIARLEKELEEKINLLSASTEQYAICTSSNEKLKDELVQYQRRLDEAIKSSESSEGMRLELVDTNEKLKKENRVLGKKLDNADKQAANFKSLLAALKTELHAFEKSKLVVFDAMSGYLDELSASYNPENSTNQTLLGSSRINDKGRLELVLGVRAELTKLIKLESEVNKHLAKT